MSFMISVCDTGPAELVQYKVHFLDNCLANILTLLFQYVSVIGQGTKHKKVTAWQRTCSAALCTYWLLMACC